MNSARALFYAPRTVNEDHWCTSGTRRAPVCGPLTSAEKLRGEHKPRQLSLAKRAAARLPRARALTILRDHHELSGAGADLRRRATHARALRSQREDICRRYFETRPPAIPRKYAQSASMDMCRLGKSIISFTTTFEYNTEEEMKSHPIENQEDPLYHILTDNHGFFSGYLCVFYYMCRLSRKFTCDYHDPLHFLVHLINFSCNSKNEFGVPFFHIPGDEFPENPVDAANFIIEQVLYGAGLKVFNVASIMKCYSGTQCEDVGFQVYFKHNDEPKCFCIGDNEDKEISGSTEEEMMLNWYKECDYGDFIIFEQADMVIMHSKVVMWPKDYEAFVANAYLEAEDGGLRLKKKEIKKALQIFDRIRHNIGDYSDHFWGQYCMFPDQGINLNLMFKDSANGLSDGAHRFLANYMLSKLLQDRCGSISYMVPEMVQGIEFGEACSPPKTTIPLPHRSTPPCSPKLISTPQPPPQPPQPPQPQPQPQPASPLGGALSPQPQSPQPASPFGGALSPQPQSPQPQPQPASPLGGALSPQPPQPTSYPDAAMAAQPPQPFTSFPAAALAPSWTLPVLQQHATGVSLLDSGGFLVGWAPGDVSRPPEITPLPFGSLHAAHNFPDEDLEWLPLQPEHTSRSSSLASLMDMLPDEEAATAAMDLGIFQETDQQQMFSLDANL
jgi:hypothetical protein